MFAERDCEGSPMPNPLEARFRRWFATFTDAELNTEAVGDPLKQVVLSLSSVKYFKL